MGYFPNSAAIRLPTTKYAGRNGTVEANVYQRSVDYPDEFANGFHVMLGTGALVTVRWEQVVVDDILDGVDRIGSRR